MDSAAKKILLIAFVFCVLSIGMEGYRYYKVYSMLQGDVQQAVVDSVELSMLDQYRQDRISEIDETVCREMFNTILREKYNLNSNLVPLDSSFIIGSIQLTNLLTEKGKYHLDGNGDAVMDVYPSMEVEGYIYMKGLVFGTNQTFKVPFKASSENRRYDMNDE